MFVVLTWCLTRNGYCSARLLCSWKHYSSLLTYYETDMTFHYLYTFKKCTVLSTLTRISMSLCNSAIFYAFRRCKSVLYIQLHKKHFITLIMSWNLSPKHTQTFPNSVPSSFTLCNWLIIKGHGSTLYQLLMPTRALSQVTRAVLSNHYESAWGKACPFFPSPSLTWCKTFVITCSNLAPSLASW